MIVSTIPQMLKLNNIQNLRQFTINKISDSDYDENSEAPIVKDHWQQYGDNDICSNSNCDKCCRTKRVLYLQ